MIAARAELADFADLGGFAGVGIDDLGFHVRKGQADRASLVFDRIGRHGHGRHRRAFGLAEHDGEGRAEFYSYLRRAQQEQGITIILVSHDMSEVAALAEWLFVLHKGQLVLQGRPREVFAEGEILRNWNIVVPPLHELLNMLRQQGMVIPNDILTLDDAFTFLVRQQQNGFQTTIQKSRLVGYETD